MAGKDDPVVPGFTADATLDAKLDALDDHLQPIKEELQEDANKGTDTETAEKGADKKEAAEKEDEAKQSESDAESDSSERDAESAGDGEDAADDGYTIDEGVEEAEEDSDVPEPPKEERAPDQSQLTAEQKYILDNLTPIKVRGYIGDSDKLEEVEVYAPEYLPDGFRFANDKEREIAGRSFTQLEQKAVQLQQDWRNQETQRATEEFQAREIRADREDVAQLQREGKIPRFKASPDSPEFEKDPGVQLVQEVLDFKDEQNAKYLEQYNAGRPYRHIGFDEAFRMYQRENPTKSNPAQTQEDKQRQDIAKRTSKTNGSSTREATQKARAHSGMSSVDLENLIESKTADW